MLICLCFFSSNFKPHFHTEEKTQTVGSKFSLCTQMLSFAMSEVSFCKIAGVHPKSIWNKPDGTFDLKELQELLQHQHDPHQYYTRF